MRGASVNTQPGVGDRILKKGAFSSFIQEGGSKVRMKCSNIRNISQCFKWKFTPVYWSACLLAFHSYFISPYSQGDIWSSFYCLLLKPTAHRLVWRLEENSYVSCFFPGPDIVFECKKGNHLVSLLVGTHIPACLQNDYLGISWLFWFTWTCM